MGQGASRARCTNLSTCTYDRILLGSVSLSFHEIRCSYSVSMPIIYRICHEFLLLCHIYEFYDGSIHVISSSPGLGAIGQSFVGAVNWLLHLILIFPQGKPCFSHRQLYLAMTSIRYRIVSYMKNHRHSLWEQFQHFVPEERS